MTPLQQQPERDTHSEDPTVPFALKVAGDWAWRLALVLIVGAMLIWLLGKISILVIPLMVATLFAALLRPAMMGLRKIGVPRGLSVAITEVGLLVLVVGGLFLVGRQMVSGIAELSKQAVTGLIQIQAWLTTGPLSLSNDQIENYLQDALDALQNNSSTIASKALGIGSGFGHFAAGLLLTLFILIFFLLEGERIWAFLVRFFPRRARPAIDGAGRRGWTSLGSYVRVQILVAAVDAVGIGAGAAIIQVPLALPLGVLVFVGSFIPVVGALVTGAVAVLLALVANGWVNALIMLAIVLAVQQLESHLLQPFIMGRAVSLHPVAVILAVAAGSSVSGILGALFAVPLLAVANSSIRYIAERAWERDPALAAEYGYVTAEIPASIASGGQGQGPGTTASTLTEQQQDPGRSPEEPGPIL
ncbi:AI-2E family transporter [Arthrobacter cryoconiti]|uniref:AI-2E family transporter n=1 Tax=Arthrobacter cryoconiti TaxID=748907 RepID=A0ABV8R358_9MICC|nr:AI-2E family transporter [Arthrobacter cryoconiti]MCC9066950.1 AI-2E family transporter [Arthrobacter cryoconiti]